MYYIESSKIIKQIIAVFERSGIWQIEEKSNNYLKYGKKFYLILHLSFVLSVALGGLLSEDRNESIFLITFSIRIFVASVKLKCILSEEKQIRAFIKDLSGHSIGDHQEFVKFNGKVNNLNKFLTVFVFFISLNPVVVVISSLPLFSREKNLPLNNIWFPLNWRVNLFYYWIAYIFEATGALLTIISLWFTAIIWYLMMNCDIKYQLLGNRLRNMFFTKPTMKMDKFSEVKELICLIKTHQSIKETVNRFKIGFSNLFFVQITTSGISICGSVYALAFGVHNESKIHFGLLLNNFFDIFIVMYFGNQIKLSSERLCYCLFESNWLEQSQSCKRNIIILTEVLKKPHELVIGKYILFNLDINTFTSIVKFSYSMFNILQHFH